MLAVCLTPWLTLCLLSQRPGRVAGDAAAAMSFNDTALQAFAAFVWGTWAGDCPFWLKRAAKFVWRSHPCGSPLGGVLHVVSLWLLAKLPFGCGG